jgi:hypothetical protein
MRSRNVVTDKSLVSSDLLGNFFLCSVNIINSECVLLPKSMIHYVCCCFSVIMCYLEQHTWFIDRIITFLNELGMVVGLFYGLLGLKCCNCILNFVLL